MGKNVDKNKKMHLVEVLRSDVCLFCLGIQIASLEGQTSDA